jgi:hypothetical protein
VAAILIIGMAFGSALIRSAIEQVPNGYWRLEPFLLLVLPAHFRRFRSEFRAAIAYIRSGSAAIVIFPAK